MGVQVSLLALYNVHPNAFSVVPGRVDFTLQVKIYMHTMEKFDLMSFVIKRLWSSYHNLVVISPMGMIFVPSIGGISTGQMSLIDGM